MREFDPGRYENAVAHRILRVGVTGGIGSGKSLVCSYFASFGIPVLSADIIAKELIQKDAGIRKGLIKELGPSAFAPGGTLNRVFVAQRLFASPSLQKKINALVHPKVEVAVKRRIENLRKQGRKIAIVEAALIYEAGLDKYLDFVIVVDATVNQRMKRLSARDGMTAAEARKRMKAQWPVKRKLQRASYVLRNNGSRSELKSSTKVIARILQIMAQQL